MRIAQIALRRRRRLTRRIREARALARAFQWPHRPIDLGLLARTDWQG